MNRLAAVLLPVLLGAAILGWSDRRDSYSCHLCRARKTEWTRSFLGLGFQRRSTPTFSGDAKSGHVHDWWRFSHYDRRGPGGCLGSGVACNAHRYRDGRD